MFAVSSFQLGAGAYFKSFLSSRIHCCHSCKTNAHGKKGSYTIDSAERHVAEFLCFLTRVTEKDIGPDPQLMFIGITLLTLTELC